MATEVKLPQISEEADSAQVSEILVSEGDTIKEEQSIIAVETDKASVEVPSTAGGKIKEIKVKEGDEISVGDVILILEDDGDEKEEEDDGDEEDQDEEASDSKKSKEKKSSDEQDEKESDEDDEDKEEEDKEEKPDKKSKDTKRNQSDEKDSDEEDDDKEKDDDVDKDDRDNKQEPKDKGDKEVPASPGVRRFARELGVDIREVKGSGDKGRISEQDVKAHVKENKGGGAGSAGQTSLPDFSQWGDIERKPLSNIRKAVAKSTANSWSAIPHVTHFDEAEVTNLEKYLEKHQEKAASKDVKLTITAILTKIVGAALIRFPKFNASLDLDEMEVIYKRYIHIGIAADTPKGLLIPIIQNVDQKDLLSLSEEIQELAEKARNQKLSSEEMQGGTFVISNLGGIGGTNFTPIIFHPQVAILGISSSYIKPVYDGSKFKPKNILPLSLSYDHRLIDGAEAARFLRWICQAIEDPLEALLG